LREQRRRISRSIGISEFKMGMTLGLQVAFRRTKEQQVETQLVKVKEASMRVKLQQGAQRFQNRTSWRNPVFATW
jgi:hypothetical protein